MIDERPLDKFLQSDEELKKKIMHIKFEKRWKNRDLAHAMHYTEPYLSRLLKREELSGTTRRRLIWFIETNS